MLNLSRLKSYVPETFMWVRAYREGTFTLPFTEVSFFLQSSSASVDF